MISYVFWSKSSFTRTVSKMVICSAYRLRLILNSMACTLNSNPRHLNMYTLIWKQVETTREKDRDPKRTCRSHKENHDVRISVKKVCKK